MSFVAMSHKSAGYVVPASDYNQFVDNDLAMYPYTTKGDISACSGSAVGRLAAGADYKFLRALASETLGLGYSYQPVQLKLDTALTEVVNTTVETTIFSHSIAGGLLSTNRILRLQMWLSYHNNTGGGAALRIKVKYGATTMIDIQLNSFYDVVGRRSVLIDTEIIALGATNSQAACLLSLGGNISAGDLAYEMPEGTASEDSTADKTLAVTVQHSAASANQGVKLYRGLLELLIPS